MVSVADPDGSGMGKKQGPDPGSRSGSGIQVRNEHHMITIIHLQESGFVKRQR